MTAGVTTAPTKMLVETVATDASTNRESDLPLREVFTHWEAFELCSLQEG